VSELTVDELKTFLATREKILNELLKVTNNFVDNETDRIEMCCNYKETKLFKNDKVGSIHEPIYSAKVIGQDGKCSRYILLKEEELVRNS